MTERTTSQCSNRASHISHIWTDHFDEHEDYWCPGLRYDHPAMQHEGEPVKRFTTTSGGCEILLEETYLLPQGAGYFLSMTDVEDSSRRTVVFLSPSDVKSLRDLLS